MAKKKKENNIPPIVQRSADEMGDNILEQEYCPEEAEREIKEIEKINDRGLTFKEEKFISEFFIDGDKNKAAIRAGYSAWSSNAAASKLMNNPRIKKEIEIRREKIRERYEISHDRVAEEYAKLAFSNVKDLFDDDGNMLPLNKIPNHVSAAISGLEIDNLYDEKQEKIVSRISKFKMIDKKNVLDSITKLMGFSENSDEKILEIGLSKLLKFFPKELQEQLKIAMLEKIN